MGYLVYAADIRFSRLFSPSTTHTHAQLESYSPPAPREKKRTLSHHHHHRAIIMAGAAAAAAGAAADDWTQAKAKGNQAYQAGNHQQAIKHFSTAIQLETPKNEGKQLHILYSNRSAAELSLSLAHEALADAKKCTELEPMFAKGWSRVGAALYRLGRYPEAMAAYEAGLQQTPGNAVGAPWWWTGREGGRGGGRSGVSSSRLFMNRFT